MIIIYEIKRPHINCISLSVIPYNPMALVAESVIIWLRNCAADDGAAAATTTAVTIVTTAAAAATESNYISVLSD